MQEMAKAVRQSSRFWTGQNNRVLLACRELDLRKPVYHATACYGHFGRPGFTWEKPKQLTIQPKIQKRLDAANQSNAPKKMRYGAH